MLENVLELMVDDFLLVKGRPERVVEFNSRFVTLFDESIHLLQDVDPIPICEKMLYSLGFNLWEKAEQEHIRFDKLTVYTAHYVLADWPDSDFEFEVICVRSTKNPNPVWRSEASSRELQYIHQLQNILRIIHQRELEFEQ